MATISQSPGNISQIVKLRREATKLRRASTDAPTARPSALFRRAGSFKSNRFWFQDLLLRLEQSLPFQAVIMLVIAIDLVVALVFIVNDEKTPLWFEVTILVVLWLDITVRILAQGKAFFVEDGRILNIFEFCVVIFCTAVIYLESELEAVIPTSWLRILGRVSRFLRTCIKAHQQKDRLLTAAQNTAQRQAFRFLENLVGDVIKVSHRDFVINALQGSLRLTGAEVLGANFEDLHLPVTVKGGFIGSLEVDVGNVMMSADENKEIRVSFKNSILIFGPIVPEWDTDSVRRRKEELLKLLFRRLDMLAPVLGGSQAKEVQRQQQPSQQATPAGKKTKAEKMKQRILRRFLNQLKVSISNVAVRYEDIHVVQPNPFVCGAVLGSLTFAPVERDGGARVSAKSCKRALEEDTVGSQSSVELTGVQQELCIDQLYVFCDTDDIISYQESEDAVFEFYSSRLRERLKLCVVKVLEQRFKDNPQKRWLLRGPMFRERFDEHSYIVFPITAKMTLLRRRGKLLEPPSSMSVHVDPIRAAIDNRQLEVFNRILLHVHDWFSNSSMACTRPLQSISDMYGRVPEKEYRLHVRHWWSHCVRLAQLKLRLTPNNLSSKLKSLLAKQVEVEYLRLVASKKELDGDEQRRKDMQVVLPVLTVLRLRLEAKREDGADQRSNPRPGEGDPAVDAEVDLALRDEEDRDEEAGQGSMVAGEVLPDRGTRSFKASQSFANEFTTRPLRVQLNVEIESIEVFVLTHTFWGSVFSCLRTEVGGGQLSSPCMSHRKAHAATGRLEPGRIGGFGFEHFGMPVCPRAPFLSARVEGIGASLSLTWLGSVGWMSGIALEVSIADVGASFFTGSDQETSVLEVQRFESENRRVVATMRLEDSLPAAQTPPDESTSGPFMESSGGYFSENPVERAARPAGRASFAAMVKALQWNGQCRIAPVRAMCFMPVVQKFLSMLSAGKRPSQVEYELALAVDHLRRPRHQSDTFNRVLTKIQDLWQGSLEFDCQLSAVRIELFQRYHRSDVLVTTLELDKVRPLISCSSQPLRFDVRLQEMGDDHVQPASPTLTSATREPSASQTSSPHLPMPKSTTVESPHGDMLWTEAWEVLPWDISMRLVHPSDVGLQVRDVAPWAEEFSYLDVKSRQTASSFGSWCQRDYLHYHLSSETPGLETSHGLAGTTSNVSAHWRKRLFSAFKNTVS